MLEQMQEQRRQDKKELAQQMEKIGEGLDRSYSLTKKALFDLLDFLKREPPTG